MPKKAIKGTDRPTRVARPRLLTAERLFSRENITRHQPGRDGRSHDERAHSCAPRGGGEAVRLCCWAAARLASPPARSSTKRKLARARRVRDGRGHVVKVTRRTHCSTFPKAAVRARTLARGGAGAGMHPLRCRQSPLVRRRVGGVWLGRARFRLWTLSWWLNPRPPHSLKISSPRERDVIKR